MEMSAAEHIKCVSRFENGKEEMNEHPLALENGNADTVVRKQNVLLQIFCIHPGWPNWSVFRPLVGWDDDWCVSV